MRRSISPLPAKVLAPYQGEQTAVVSLLLKDGEMTCAVSGAVDLEAQAASEDLIFEIGSITKVFTAILLAVLVEEGKVDPSRPIKDIASDLYDVPEWITPQTLATHTSGLPRLHVPVWKALISSMPDDPYASFSRADLTEWFRARKPSTPPRRPQYAYSNLGFGLLGEALAMSEGRPYLELLRDKVIAPLGLVDTAADLTSAQQARFMSPFSPWGKRVVPWTFQAMAGAGCLRSTARDLGQLSAVVMKSLDAPSTLLERAIHRTTLPLHGMGPRGAMEPVAQCLGWLSIRVKPDAPRLLFHNGGTAGSSSALYICPEANSSAVILANRGVAAGLWSSLRVSWSNPDHAMSDLFAGASK